MNIETKIEHAIEKQKKLIKTTNFSKRCGYNVIYNQMFTTDIHQILKNDNSIYNNNIYNLILNPNNLQNKLFTYTKNDIKYINYLENETKIFLEKCFDLILEEKNYNIQNETNQNIIKYYYGYCFLELYHNALEENNGDKIYEDINNIFQKINNMLIMFYGCNQNYVGYFYTLDKVLEDSVIKEQFIKLLTTYEYLNKPIEKTQQTQSIITIGNEYNIKKGNYYKDDLLKIAIGMNVIGASRLTIPLLEEAIIEKIEGITLKEKAKKYNIEGKNITNSGYRTAILEYLTGTMININKHICTNVLPKTIKSIVWDKQIGREKGIGKCYVCIKEIDSKHFELGHIIAKSKGGEDTINNLRPICSLCNKSIGNKNMDEFKKQYKL